MGELCELCLKGDSKLLWDSEKEVEVEVAKNAFDKLRKEGYFAYEVEDDGGKRRVITEFDPEAGKIILAPPMQGG